MTVEQDDKLAGNAAKGFRITLEYITAGIENVFYTTADSIPSVRGISLKTIEVLKPMTLCLVVMRNGFVVIGKSCPVDPGNFDAELGRKFAYDDAIRQLWVHYGFAYKEGGLP